jgi:glycerol kinase
MAGRCVLAIDQGTSSTRAFLYDRDGETATGAQQEFRQDYPKPGWVEHDALLLWETVRRTAAAATRQAKLPAGVLAAVGLANQRETTVLWERSTGRPLAPAIVWQDRRTTAFCAKLQQRGFDPLFRRKTGLLIDPYFSGTKLAWLLDHIPGARRRAEKGELAFGTVDSWLIWQLTSGMVHATDVSNASRTLLLNLRTGAWDDELLRILRIPPEVLPVVKSSSEFYGEIDSIPELRGVPIMGVAGDQQAALFGQACFEPGQAKNTYGTGCFLLLHTGTKPVRSRHNLLTTIAWRLGPKAPLEYALEGSVFVAGGVVRWLRDALTMVGRPDQVEDLVDAVKDNGGVYFVPAFIGLGAPHWDPTARGLLIGLTSGSNSGHIARAAIESIAFQTADLVGAMQSDAGRKIYELCVDGGAASNDGLLQFQSDLLRIPVTRPDIVETTALGAGYLAGLAVGIWKDRDEIAARWKAAETFRPGTPAKKMRQIHQTWLKAVERSKCWADE